MAFGLSPKTRLIITISISFAFFVAEITGSSTQCAKCIRTCLKTNFISVVAFKTRSLALLADAFHYVRSLGSYLTRRPQLADLS